ncbi:hypothetical protein OAC89_02545 [Deltaproteobacteria bacterium]|nr:hypothetical protein [Deltaproteobacteria bacterium]
MGVYCAAAPARSRQPFSVSSGFGERTVSPGQNLLALPKAMPLKTPSLLASGDTARISVLSEWGGATTTGRSLSSG